MAIQNDVVRRAVLGPGDDQNDDLAWKMARLDAICPMDDPAMRANNRYVLQYMAGKSEDYDDGAFLRTYMSMFMLKDAASYKGKLDGQAEAIRSGSIRDPRTGIRWRLHPEEPSDDSE